MTKFVIVVGGVISGVGKGIATASMGKILQEYGFDVTAIKIDPYINFDAGTLRPTEHGEVYVTEDGGETDQDIGTYERFMNIKLSRKNSLTTGQIYKRLIEKERNGDFLGKTVEFIPHIPEEIKQRIKEASEKKEICLVEIGGTIGDYENIPFLLAVRNLKRELGEKNVLCVLVTYLPIPSHIEEMKTKPTQTAIRLLEEQGINADIILCRGRDPLDEVRKQKIERYANISPENVISMPDISSRKGKSTLYIVPLELEKEKLGNKILEKLDLKKKKEADWEKWKEKIQNLTNSEKKIKIAVIGKYLEIGSYNLTDSYMSISEAIKHASAENKIEIEISWLNSKELEKENNLNSLLSYNGIIIPGGFGTTGTDGKISAIKFCRENNIPFLGLCLGLQLAVIEFARNVCNIKDANSTEIDFSTTNPIITIMDEQNEKQEKGGTMRLGSFKTKLSDGRVKEIYGSSEISERHRHRYEVNPKYHQILEENGLNLSGKSQDNKLVEFIEISSHKFFIATQSHPEFNSTLMNPSPLFSAFVKACIS